MATSKPDPGPLLPPDEVRLADAQIADFLQATQSINVPFAAAHLRAHPLSDNAVAMMAWRAHQWMKSAENSKKGSGPRNSDSDEELLADRALFVEEHGTERGWLVKREQEFDEWKKSGGVGKSPLSSRAIANRFKKIRK